MTIQTSHSGRHNVVRYPVHKSIICGKGVDGLLAYSGLVSRFDLKESAKSVFGAIELAVADRNKSNERVTFVDMDQADKALTTFRDSVENVVAYERGWNGSGVQPVVDWLSSHRTKDGDLDNSLKALILTLLDSAEEGALAKENRQVQEQIARSISDDTREDLKRAVTSWAEKAHSELRSSLEQGFASKPWRELAWWKLFWHVDDVGMITSEILEKKYLRQAEKEVVYTTGRLQQAGLLDEAQIQGDMAFADLKANEPGQKDSNTNQPWPTQVTASRARLLNTTVPSLQAVAQRLVFFSVSTTSLTSALSALTYVSFPSASISEVCVAVAVGLIYSLRRQQTKWEAARTVFENEVREDGRTSLRETEEALRTVVRDGGREVEDVSEREAMEAIDRARRALDEVK